MPNTASARRSVVPAPTARAATARCSRNFFRRELTTRYLGSISGLAWAFVHPLALLAVYHFVFTTVFRAERFGGKSFLLFVAVALWPWLAAQEALQRGDGQPRRLRGPDPQGRVPARARRLCVGRARRWRCSSPATSWCWSCWRCSASRSISKACCSRFRCGSCSRSRVTGSTLFLAALQVFVRDVEHMLMPVLMILMYLTPILYPLTLVPGSDAALGRRQSVRLAGRRGCATRCSTGGSRCEWGDARRAGGRRSPLFFAGPLGVPAPVAAFRGFRVSRVRRPAMPRCSPSPASARTTRRSTPRRPAAARVGPAARPRRRARVPRARRRVASSCSAASRSASSARTAPASRRC